MPRLLLLALLLIMTADAASEIVDHPEQVRPLLPGQSVPAFKLKSIAGEAVHVDPAAFEKPVVFSLARSDSDPILIPSACPARLMC
jgi:hypothetical protein